MERQDLLNKMIDSSLQNLRKDNYVSDIVAAKIIDVSPQSLRNWRHLGRGPVYHKRGRMVRYKVQDLLNFMAAGRIDPEARQG